MSNPTPNETLEGAMGHHVHNPDDPLPGGKGAAHTVDYSPDTITHAKLPPSEVGDTQDFQPHHGGTHHQHSPQRYPKHTEAGVRCGNDTTLPTDRKGVDDLGQQRQEVETEPTSRKAKEVSAPHIEKRDEFNIAQVPANAYDDETLNTTHSTEPRVGDHSTNNPSIGDKIIGKTTEVNI
jgi:hypothetical protein